MATYQQSYPLAGETILITRAVSSDNQFRQMLEKKGATVLEMPTLEIKPPSSWEKLDNAIENLNTFDWIILTSGNGVEYFCQRMEKLGKSVNLLKNLKIAVVGKKTAQYLDKYQLSPTFIPPDFIADSLVSNFPDNVAQQKILFPRVETGGREILVQEFTAKGAQVMEIPAYQSGCPDFFDDMIWNALTEKLVTIITFTSSKTVRNFYDLINTNLALYPQFSLDYILEESAIASIGPQTSQTCKELFNRVDIEAEEYTLEGLVNSLVNKAINRGKFKR